MPETEEVPAAVLDARRQAARRLYVEAQDARLNAEIFVALSENEEHPVDASVAEEAQTAAVEKMRVAESTALFANLDLSKESNRVRNDELRAQLTEWKRLRAIHADMAANPDAYGGVDLGGTPIDVDAQNRMIIEYDTAIEKTEAELGS